MRTAAASDARLCLVAAGIPLAALGLVVLPQGDALGLLWLLGGTVAVLLGPVVAGLAAWASVICVARGGLSAGVRRLHVAALLVVTAYAGALAAAHATGSVAWVSG